MRGTRGVGAAVYEEKGRDIYDLLWYMGKKIVPDFDYMIAKGIDVNDPKTLFDKLTIQMNKVSDENLKNDLTPLFVDQMFISNWLKNWRESYLRLLSDYKIHTIKGLSRLKTRQDFNSDNFSFLFWYETEEKELIKIEYRISDHWILFKDIDMSMEIEKEIENKSKILDYGWGSKKEHHDKLLRYASLFYKKTEKYFKKTNNIILGDVMTTKLIRMTADNLNQKEQIVLNKSALLSCELDDLLK